METKICSKCHKRKKIIEFSKDKGKKDGRRYGCKECRKNYSEEYYLKNKDRIQKTVKKYNETHKEQRKETLHRGYLKTRNKTKKERKISSKKCKEKYKERYKRYYKIYLKNYRKQRKQNDPIFKLVCNFRIRIYHAVKHNYKKTSSIKLLGCTIPELKLHLEKQFKQGMSWENYGRYGWHIDHIKPCCTFDLSKKLEQQKCFNYTNLQPLWAKENLSKNKF